MELHGVRKNYELRLRETPRYSVVIFFTLPALGIGGHFYYNKTMLSREDFIFTIGYDGPAAVVDGQAKKRYSSLSTGELAEKGLYRAAYSSAVFSKDPKEVETVLEIYNRATGSSVPESSLQRLFGVFPVEVSRSIVL